MRIPHFSNMQVARAIVTTRQNGRQIAKVAQRVIPQPRVTRKNIMTAMLFASSLVPNSTRRPIFRPQITWGEKISMVVANAKKAITKKLPAKKPAPKNVSASNLKLITEEFTENPKELCLRFNDLLLKNDKGNNLLNNKGQAFIRIAKKYNVDPVVLMSIALHESARGTSDVAKLRHNVGGVTLNKKGVKGIYRFKLYNRVEDCIDQMAETLSIHNKKSNIQTVKELAKAGKYCGKNEAKGWIKGVMFYVKHLKGIET